MNKHLRMHLHKQYVKDFLDPDSTDVDGAWDATDKEPATAGLPL